MILSKGQMLGPYEIEAPAGKGGMGEVYRARDTRLDRKVAIKVLPSHAAIHSDARVRFEREAKTISSLNHPNICVLHDIGREGEIDYLVMEYLKGETLEDRLKKGKLDTEEAVIIGAKIASGLAEAHRNGLIHRDLKPGNIFLTKAGAKLLDFGLAKLHAEVVSGMGDETATTPITGAGVIVGTLQYMSPEQVEGKEADARSDIFSFGVTLYEMISGQQAFSGKSKASLISSIMKDVPRPISELQPTSPPALDRLITKCLEKDPDERWQSAKDLKDELEWIASGSSETGATGSVPARRRLRLRPAWLVSAILAIVALILGMKLITGNMPESRTARFTISKPENLTRIEWPQVSPDGRYLAFLGYDSAGASKIWIRPLNSQKAYPLNGTEGAFRPFWSPDSKHLAFFDRARGLLKKCALSGGQPQIICNAGGADGSWGQNDIILFDSYHNNSIGLVSASGGEPRFAAAPDSSSGEFSCAWPCFLPDGRHFIFSVGNDTLDNLFKEQVLKLGIIGRDESKPLGIIESRAVFCEPGYILYLKKGFMVAHPFNLDKLVLEGEPIVISDSITESGIGGGINVNASANGTMVFNKSTGDAHRLVWVDRDGNVVDTIANPADYRDIVLSPDGSRAAFVMNETRSSSRRIGIIDLQSIAILGMTPREEFNMLPHWSPEGKLLAYLTLNARELLFELRFGRLDIQASPLVRSDSKIPIPLNWSEPNRLLYFEYPWSSGEEGLDYHLMAAYLDDTTRIDTIWTSPDACIPYGISPDGRYFLYTPIKYYGTALFIRDLKENGQEWRLPAAGQEAHWSPLGNEIFFFNKNDFMVMETSLKGCFKYGTPKKLFSRKHLHGSSETSTLWGYDVSSDAQRFLFITAESATHIEVVLNWYAELEN